MLELKVSSLKNNQLCSFSFKYLLNTAKLWALALSRAHVLEIIFSFLLIENHASASGGIQGKNLGVGFFIGNPTSLTLKYFADNETAYAGGIAFALSDYFLFYGDYVIHYHAILGNRNRFVAQLVPYLGLGGVFVMTSSDRRTNDGYLGKKSGTMGLGLRVPIGIEWQTNKPPIGVYIEIAPGISVIPETAAEFMGGFGVRYYF